MTYDNEALIEMCDQVDLLEYASQTVDFDGRGDSYAAHCPRHIDVTPSLMITPSKNLFHCFSCGCGGNILNWMTTFEGITFQEAVEKLTVLTGTNLKNLKKCESLMIYKEIQKSMKSSEPADISDERTILAKEDYEQYTIEDPDEWINEGIEPSIMRKYDIRVDNKRKRIVYPVYDNDFNLIGVKGRTRLKNYKDMNIKKYMNYYKIGTVDYFVGMMENKDSITAKGKAIIFEGIKSGMKVEAWGYDYWLASETSYLNPQQVMLLIKLGIKEVTIAFDNDVQLSKIKECTAMLRRYMNVYAIQDRKRRLGDKTTKMSPCDMGREIFEILLNERVRI